MLQCVHYPEEQTEVVESTAPVSAHPRLVILAADHTYLLTSLLISAYSRGMQRALFRANLAHPVLRICLHLVSCQDTDTYVTV